MKITKVKRVQYHGTIHNIGVVGDESYVVENKKVKNCRGMWVAILKTDADLPPAKALPKYVTDRFETVGGVPSKNEYRPFPTARIAKGSRADIKAKDGLINP